MELLNEIIAKRPEIIWAETAAILHDIGKLSEAFIKYRQEWREIECGYDKDPHDHDFLKNSDPLIIKFEKIKKWFDSPVDFSLNTIGEKTVSITDAINKHVEPGKNIFLSMLKAADGKDAAIDRNNPLFSADQKGKIYKTNIFGAESEFDVSSVESSRKQLYESLCQLASMLPDGKNDLSFDDRKTLLKTIQNNFEKAFSDTTRPDNDTNLWEHCYAVASIFKVMLLHWIIYGERLDRFDKVRFGIFGIGWNGLAYLSNGHKIGDVTGRKEYIESLKQQIKEKIEHDFLLGNTIYEDDNGIFFLIPMLPSEIDLDKTDFDKLNNYGQLLKEVQKTIINLFIERTSGELLPKFHLIQDTKYITHLVRCINELKGKSAYPILHPSDELSKKLKNEWTIAGQVQVCPVCRRMPAIKDWDICKGCIEIRKNGNISSREKKSEKDEIKDTPFISEIVSANKDHSLKNRAALVVAKIGLENWLNGRMVRSLFVTEAKGLEKELAELGNTKHFETRENEIKAWLTDSCFGNLIRKGYDYHRIKEEIDRCYQFAECKDDNERNYAKNTWFLYDRRNPLNQDVDKVHDIWKGYKNSAIEEYYLQDKDTSSLLYNVLCAKTPTPSTILDIWNTTDKFFKDFKEDKTLLGLSPKKRWKANIEKPDGVGIGAAYEGKIFNSSVEVIWLSDDDNSVWILGDINIKTGNQIILKGKFFGSNARDITLEIKDQDLNMPYFPCRVITAAPDMFMAIVPADSVLDISQILYDAYIKKFGKVMGRLPISIGNIFFNDRMPMFVVLDAGRRMLDNFEMLHLKRAEFVVDKNQKISPVSDPDFTLSISEVNISETIRVSSGIKWNIPFRLGDGRRDFYHPYFFVKQGCKDYSFRKNFFRTIMGDVIHCTEIEPGDTLELFPNYYDFEFLDSNTRRHELSLGGRYRRQSNVADFNTKPLLLDELEQKIKHLWRLFHSNSSSLELTDSKLRNLQSLWLAKYQEWDVNLDSKQTENYRRWIHLIKSSLKKEFAGAVDFQNFLFETIETGLFFDILELYMGILKKKIDKKGGN